MIPCRPRIRRGCYTQRPWVVTCHCELRQRFHFWDNAIGFAQRHAIRGPS